MSTTLLQVRALALELRAREKLFLQGACLFGQIGNKAMQILRRIAETGGELIEWNQRGVDFCERQIPLLQRPHLA
jgi:hypothetical protein